MDTPTFLLMIKLNILVVVIYVIFNVFKKRENNGGFIMKAVIMFLCPVIGPAFFAFSHLLYRDIFSTRADLSDVMFSKDRVKINLHADEERERNMVSLEEALAITDKENLRNLMMNVVKGNVKDLLSTVSMALDSEDSETAHYAASVLQDELSDFRNNVQKGINAIEERDEKQPQYASELMDYMNGMLSQRVFTDTEQKSFVYTMDRAAEVLFRTAPDMMTGNQFEAVILRLLEIKEYSRCGVWCERSMKQYPNLLSSYTCRLKLYFSMGEKEKFFETMDELKKSNIVIDRETLELIRVFTA